LQSQAPKQSAIMSSSALPTLPLAIRLPKFEMAGGYDEKSPADRWLTQLEYDFQQSNQIPPPALYLEAINILFIEDAATWLANTPRMQQIIDIRNSARYESSPLNSGVDPYAICGPKRSSTRCSRCQLCGSTLVVMATHVTISFHELFRR
jgi:hypothetical protein